MPENKKIYLIDASSLFFRAYYAIPFMQAPDKKSKKGFLNTNAVYGYLKITLKILEDFKPKYLVYCFDRKEPSHRVDYYPPYKANRGEMPEDLEEQMPYIHQITEILGIPKMDLKKYEADDLIGSYAYWGMKNNFEVTIISSDKDFSQLVSKKGIHLFDPMKEQLYDEARVQKKWGVKPSQIVDYLALAGDASDNIPGVRGIGPKGAVKLLTEHKTLEGIYKNVEKIPDTLSKKLKDSKEDAFVSQKLARIVTDLKLVSKIKDLEKKPAKQEPLKKFLNDLDFKSVYKKMFSEAPKKESPVKPPPSSKKIKGLIQHKLSLNELSESLRPYEEVGCIIFENQINILFRKTWVRLQTDSFRKVGEILSYKKAKWWGYDLKSIWKTLEPKNPIPSWDLMIAEHLAEGRPSSSFSDLVQKELGEEITSENAALCLIQLRKIYEKKIEDLKYVYENIELPLIPVLYKMEERGVVLDKAFLVKEQKSLEKNISEIESKIFSLAEHPFNVSSPKQLSYVLFEELGLTKGRKTKMGYSTDNDVLWNLKKEHPIASLLLDYRELFKLKTTYADGLLSSLGNSNRVHTCFKQTLTATGRLSSTHPNLQNIPIRTERGRRIRKAFVASQNHQFISADYSQIELRILAHFSKDKGLKTAFSQGEDIHKSTAAELFNLHKEDITPEERRIAKAVNFGITYGQSAFGLSSTLGVSRERGQELVNRYFKKFPKVREYIEDTLNQARKRGFAETLFGRRRNIPELFSSNQRLKKFGERAIVNSAIQGTASDLVKIAMIQLAESVWSPLLLQVHDELLFECSDDSMEYEEKSIQNIMEGGKNLSLDVPLKVNIGRGKNWDSAMH